MNIIFVGFFYMLFISLSIIIYNSGWLGPSVVNSVTVDIASNETNKKVAMLSPVVTVSQQQLWLQIVPVLSKNPSKKPTFEVNLYIYIWHNFRT